LQELGRRIAAATGDPRVTEFLFQRLSVAVQRGNAACVLGTCTDSCSDDFLLFNYSIGWTLMYFYSHLLSGTKVSISGNQSVSEF